MSPLELLKKYWGYDQFRPLQLEVIESLLTGHDTLVLMPTGGGKSLCYQIPALAMEGMTLVVSPLIALMKDQVSQLRQRHIKAACLYQGMNHREIELVLNRCVVGNIKLLYVSPERLLSSTFLNHLRQMPINAIAVDEAHCISQWGYDFRPPYLDIAKIRPLHPKAPIIALTATATPVVVDDICKQLHMHGEKRFQSSFFRSNLRYGVIREHDKQGRLLRLVRGIGGSGIIYVRNRRRTHEVADMLNHNGITAAAYHAGISLKERDLQQQGWQRSTRGIMVATNAFGMGIDKADVRFVIHLDIPESPEAYFQEAGRAGRDGKAAYAIMLYDDADIEHLNYSFNQSFPSLKFIKNVYRGIGNYYQIPVGSGMDCRFTFQFNELCQTYGFDIHPFFSALHFLEREGLIALPEQSELQSKLFIPIGKEELYHFQVEHHVAGDILSTILRMYGGLFTDFTPIIETQIARRCQVSEERIINTLTELDRHEIVVYQRKEINPLIIFTQPRINERDLYISDENYKFLKENAQRRRDAMIAYIHNNHDCRSQQLLHYFGEEQQQNCGCCDICHHKATSTDLRSRITSLLDQKPMTIRDLNSNLGNIDPDELATLVRQMLDHKELRMDKDMLLSLPRQ